MPLVDYGSDSDSEPDNSVKEVPEQPNFVGVQRASPLVQYIVPGAPGQLISEARSRRDLPTLWRLQAAIEEPPVSPPSAESDPKRRKINT